MTEVKEQIDQIIEKFRQERDELRVRAHLAKGELLEEWEKIENKLGKLESRAKEIKAATAEASKDIASAAQLLTEELRKGFENMRKRL